MGSLKVRSESNVCNKNIAQYINVRVFPKQRRQLDYVTKPLSRTQCILRNIRACHSAFQISVGGRICGRSVSHFQNKKKCDKNQSKLFIAPISRPNSLYRTLKRIHFRSGKERNHDESI